MSIWRGAVSQTSTETLKAKMQAKSENPLTMWQNEMDETSKHILD